MARTFTLNDKQDRKVKKWFSEHDCNEVAKRARHRSLRYSFTPTGIGDSIVVKCTGCKKKLDVTEYESW
jgi:hypothetical protein